MSDTPYFTCVFQMQQCSIDVARHVCDSRVDASKHLSLCLCVYCSWGMLKEAPQQQIPLIKCPEYSLTLTEVNRWSQAFDEHTLCINLDCRKRSFQVFDDLHLPVILCNNFLHYLSLILLCFCQWSNIIFWIKTCGWRQIPHVTVFHVRLSCLVLSSALYKQAGCGCACGHVLSTSEGQLWGSSFSLTYNTDGNIQDLFQPLVSCLSRQHCWTIVIFPQCCSQTLVTKLCCLIRLPSLWSKTALCASFKDKEIPQCTATWSNRNSTFLNILSAKRSRDSVKDCKDSEC